MATNSEITISLPRTLNATDEKAIKKLISQWLVYNVEVKSNRSSSEIKLFHTKGATPDLVRELSELFPNENMIGV